MRTAAATPANTACSFWRRKRWRRRREWTLAPMPPITMCASPTRGRWRTSRRPPRESGALLLLRLAPEDFQARALREHLVRVLRGGLVERAGIGLERRLGVAEAALVLAQDLRADEDVDLRLEQRGLAAVVDQLVEVVFRNHLHQALGADGALRHRVVARLDCHHGEDEERIHRVLLARSIGCGDVARHRAFRYAVALGNELGDGALLAIERRLNRGLNRPGDHGAGLEKDLAAKARHPLQAVPLQGEDHQTADGDQPYQRQHALRARVGTSHERLIHLPPPCPGALFGLWVG